MAKTYTFEKVLPAGCRLFGDTLWDPKDTEAKEKDSYIVLFDGLPVKKGGDGELEKGTYIGQIEYKSAGCGGTVEDTVISFIYAHRGHTYNDSEPRELPFTFNSFGINGATLSVETRTVSHNVTPYSSDQILLKMHERYGKRKLTKDMKVTLKLRKMI